MGAVSIIRIAAGILNRRGLEADGIVFDQRTSSLIISFTSEIQDVHFGVMPAIKAQRHRRKLADTQNLFNAYP